MSLERLVCLFILCSHAAGSAFLPADQIFISTRANTNPTFLPTIVRLVHKCRNYSYIQLRVLPTSTKLDWNNVTFDIQFFLFFYSTTLIFRGPNVLHCSSLRLAVLV
ncbi:hypothetical protein BJ165DRAFT_8298 [Panaeolus papilionaceus]|nr:hypothetical protein BJ165DRAFT_8298 [Panaeolus papilionaceus]